jgi:excisionase family DNA binding protein
MALLLTMEKTAEELSMSRAKVAALIARGEIPSIKIGRSRRVPLDRLRAWVEEQAARDGGTWVPGYAEVAQTDRRAFSCRSTAAPPISARCPNCSGRHFVRLDAKIVCGTCGHTLITWEQE